MAGLEVRASERDGQLHPVVRDVGAAVERDPGLFALVHRMFRETPHAPPHDATPPGPPLPRDFYQLPKRIDVLTTPTFYNNTGLACLPLIAMITSIMATNSGYTAFLDTTVNSHLKRILQTWGWFLASPASALLSSRSTPLAAPDDDAVQAGTRRAPGRPVPDQGAGMAEVPTCEIAVQAGQRVARANNSRHVSLRRLDLLPAVSPRNAARLRPARSDAGTRSRPNSINSRVATVRAHHTKQG